MGLNFMLVIDDGGELKSVQSTEIDKFDPKLALRLDQALNEILDEKAIAAGEYDPADNDTPIEVLK